MNDIVVIDVDKDRLIFRTNKKEMKGYLNDLIQVSISS